MPEQDAPPAGSGGSFQNRGTRDASKQRRQEDQLAERVHALKKEVRELRETLSPLDKLRRVVERMRRKTKHIPARELNQAIDRSSGSRGSRWPHPRVAFLEGGADTIVTEDARDLFSLKVIKVRGFTRVRVVDAKAFPRQLRTR